MKVYPVDLMQLYLTRRNLDGIAGIDLAGITPLVEKTVKLGDGADLRRQGRSDRPAPDQGRGLPGDGPGREPVCLGHRAGLAAGDGGARRAGAAAGCASRSATPQTKEFVPKVQVKVIGSDNPQFISGETDLRGVFVAEGVQGSRHGRRPQGDRRSTPSTAARRSVGAHDRSLSSADRRGQAPHSRSHGQGRSVPRRQPQDAEHVQLLQADRAAAAALSISRPSNGKGAAAGGFR